MNIKLREQDTLQTRGSKRHKGGPVGRRGYKLAAYAKPSRGKGRAIENRKRKG